jgi:hypothetical protein
VLSHIDEHFSTDCMHPVEASVWIILSTLHSRNTHKMLKDVNEYRVVRKNQAKCRQKIEAPEKPKTGS